MNEWVAPHRLVNVSAFEEDHPNSSKLFNIVVLQSGNGVKPNTPQSEEPIIGGIYNWSVLLGNEGWEVLL